MTVTYKVVRHKQVGNHYVVRAENVDPTTEEVIRELSSTENPLNYPDKPVDNRPAQSVVSPPSGDSNLKKKEEK